MNILDYVILGMFAIFLIIGFCKGFIKTLLSLAVWGGGIALIYFFGNKLGVALLNTSIGDMISNGFSGLLNGDSASLMVTSIDGQLAIANSSISIDAALTDAGVPFFLHALLKGMMLPDMTLAMSVGTGMAKYVCIAIVSVAIFAILGIAAFIIWGFIKKGLKKARLSGVNRLIGALLYGGIAFFVISLVMIIIDMMSGLSFMFPVLEMRSQGVISKWFAENNVIKLLIEVVAKKG